MEFDDVENQKIYQANLEARKKEKKVYKARCHCAAIRFTVAIPPLETGASKPVQCNCSVCTKKGYLLVYPVRSDVNFQRGEDKVKAYLFANPKNNLPHWFCPNCGTSILLDFKNFTNDEFGDLREMLGVNVGKLD